MASGTAMTEQQGSSAIEDKESVATGKRDAAAVLAEAERRVTIETRLRMQAAARTAEARRDAAAARLAAEQAAQRVRELEMALRPRPARFLPLKNAAIGLLRRSWGVLPLPVRRLARRVFTVVSWT